MSFWFATQRQPFFTKNERRSSAKKTKQTKKKNLITTTTTTIYRTIAWFILLLNFPVSRHGKKKQVFPFLVSLVEKKKWWPTIWPSPAWIARAPTSPPPPCGFLVPCFIFFSLNWTFFGIISLFFYLAFKDDRTLCRLDFITTTTYQMLLRFFSSSFFGVRRTTK